MPTALAAAGGQPEGRDLHARALVTKGYWNAPEKTAEAFYGDWLRSGDVGYLDEEGFLFVTDRTKDMILTGAENVASSEVEAALYAFAVVAEAAVIGVHDDKWGERITAVVVLNLPPARP